VFLEMLGARDWGLRVTLQVPEQRGFLARLSGRIAERGGNIVSLGTFSGDDPANRQLTIKVQDMSRAQMQDALAGLGAELVDMRETH